MADIKKVIKELEDIQKHLDTGYSFAITWKSKLIRDTLALLKEQHERIETLESLRRIEQEGRRRGNERPNP